MKYLTCVLCIFFIINSIYAQPEIEENSGERQFIQDDLYVIGNHCVGLDCPQSGLAFAKPLVMRALNTGILFFDSSNSANFNSNDWEIEINESINGGAAHFAVVDVSGGDEAPFKVRGGAPTGSLFIDSIGRTGMGTTSPQYKLQVNGGIGLTGRVFGASDIRLKKEIKSIENAMDLILAMDGKSYLFKREEFEDFDLPSGQQYGLIAQEVEEILPDLVENRLVAVDEEKTLKALDYNGLIPILVNALKEQHEEMKKKDDQINRLKETLDHVLNRLDELEK